MNITLERTTDKEAKFKLIYDKNLDDVIINHLLNKKTLQITMIGSQDEPIVYKMDIAKNNVDDIIISVATIESEITW